MIMAGGTGGHVFPALAIAEELHRRGAEVIWLGTRQGVEARLVPAAGFSIHWISVGGLRGKGIGTWLAAPLRLALACAQSWVLVLRLWPRAVLGMGGFVTGPGGLAAWLLARPLILHEQNAIGGLTNRLLRPLARRVLCGFPGVFAGAKAQWIGNPVRAEIAALAPPATRLADRSGPMRLLVLGGSRGAVALNELLPPALAAMAPTWRPQVRHQTGAGNEEATAVLYQQHGVRAQITPFIDDMAAAYAWADLVFCRAGALTLAELTAAGVAAVLVPYPHAVDDHQTANARHLVEAKAALLAPQHALTPGSLARRLEALAADRAALLEMARAARRLGKPAAAGVAADACLEVAVHD